MKFRSRLYYIMICLIAIAICSVPHALRADTVLLKNGDRITGTATKLEAGKLSFKIAYAEAITIPWDEVASLTMIQPLLLSTPNGTLSVSSVERSKEGLILTTPSGPKTLDAAAVTIMRTAVDQKAYEDSLHPSWVQAWAANVNLSLALAHGNSETTTFSAGFTATRVTHKDKTQLYANTLYSKNGNATPSTSANTSSGGFRYDHNLDPKLFAFGSSDFTSDALQNLDLRSIVGGGFGWHASKTPRQSFDVMGGVVWIHETYSPTPTNSFTAINIGEQYSRKVGIGSLFSEQAYFYPNLNQTGEYQFSVDSSFSTKIGKIFTWQTTFNDKYTSFPPAGTLSNDLILTTGLGITLARH